MIVILRRADLPRHHSTLAVDKLRLHHLGFDTVTINKAELIVFLEDNKVNVLRSTEWPLGKPMSAAELYRFVAEHAMDGKKAPNL